MAPPTGCQGERRPNMRAAKLFCAPLDYLQYEG